MPDDWLRPRRSFSYHAVLSVAPPDYRNQERLNFFRWTGIINRSRKAFGIAMVSTKLKIDGERLWKTIQDTARWGAIPDSTGMCRLSCSDEDKAVREWFVEQTTELGCLHKVCHY